jgi:hypothetical protein
MPLSTTLAEAKGFLRVADATEDALVGLLIDAAETRVAAATGLTLSPSSPAPVRLAVLVLVAHAYEHRAQSQEGGVEPPSGLVEAWLAPYRQARL